MLMLYISTAMSFECECKKTLESKKSLNKHQKKCKVRVHVMEIARLKANHKAEIALLNDELSSVKASLRAQHKDEIAKLESRHKDELISLLKSAAVTPVAPAGTQAPAAPQVQKRISDADFLKLCNPVSWTTFMESLEITEDDIKFFLKAKSLTAYMSILEKNIQKYDHLTRPIRMVDRSRGKFEIYNTTWVVHDRYLPSMWEPFTSKVLCVQTALEKEGVCAPNFDEPQSDQHKAWGLMLGKITHQNLDKVHTKIHKAFLNTIPNRKEDKDAYLESQ